MYDLVAKLISKGCKCAIEILGKETEETIAPYSGDQPHQPTTLHCLTILWLITCPRPAPRSWILIFHHSGCYTLHPHTGSFLSRSHSPCPLLWLNYLSGGLWQQRGCLWLPTTLPRVLPQLQRILQFSSPSRTLCSPHDFRDVRFPPPMLTVTALV